MDKYSSKIKNSSFLITGGAGFIGSNLVNFLINNDAKLVRVIDNLSNGNIKNINHHFKKNNFEFFEYDIINYSDCEISVKNIDYISHQAALGSVPRSIKDPVATNDANVTGFLNMITAAKNNKNIKRFVYAASSSTYGNSLKLPKIEGNEGDPLSPYAVSKLVDEIYADVFSRVYDFHSIGLRYFNVFGPNQDPENPYAAVIPLFFNAALNQVSPTIFGDGLTSRDFTFVDNVVQANIKSFFEYDNLNFHEVLNIALGKRTTLNELWEHIKNISKNDDLIACYSDERPGDVKHSLADIRKAKKLIKYEPKIFIKEGLKKTYDWLIKK